MSGSRGIFAEGADGKGEREVGYTAGARSLGALRAAQWVALMGLLVGCGSSSSSGPGAKGLTGGSGPGGGAPTAGQSTGAAGTGDDKGGSGNQGGGAGSAASGGKGGSDVKPPEHVVVPCDAAEVGKWEEITPPAVLSNSRYMAGEGFGMNAMVLDSSNWANITIGTDAMGIYRSTDCGATWTHVNVGTSAAELDGGTQWAMSLDAFAPDTIYTVSGYGTNGVFKTTNAGKDWEQVLKPEYAKNFIFGGFTAQVRVDPTLHDHVIITPHFTCENGNSENCFQETFDGGKTWSVVQDAPSAGEGARIAVVDQQTWFSGLGFDGLFRTADSGKTWQLVKEGYAYEVFHRPGGKYYVPTAFGISQSDDGVTWTNIEGSAGAHIVIATDKRIYASTGGFCVSAQPQPFNPITSAPIDDPTKWTVDTGYSNTRGSGDLKYDPDHHILYTSNCLGGLWRVRTE